MDPKTCYGQAQENENIDSFKVSNSRDRSVQVVQSVQNQPRLRSSHGSRRSNRCDVFCGSRFQVSDEARSSGSFVTNEMRSRANKSLRRRLVSAERVKIVSRITRKTVKLPNASDEVLGIGVADRSHQTVPLRATRPGGKLEYGWNPCQRFSRR